MVLQKIRRGNCGIQQKELTALKIFAQWIINNKPSVLLEADISKKNKEIICFALGYSADGVLGT